MKGRYLGWRAFAFVSVSAMSLAAAQAQTTSNEPSPASSPATDTDNDTAVGDIIVTAQKRSQNLSDTPMSITALGGEQLQERGINNAADLAKVTPGLTFVDSGAATPVYSLRGVGFFDQSIGARPTVSVYQNEVPLPFAIMSTGASLDLERVEVLKGPQGTLFGQNATGGAINYVAAQPSSVTSGQLMLGYGRFSAFEAQGHVTGAITDGVNARLAFRTEQTGDWQRSYTRDDTLGATRVSQGRAIVAVTPATGLTVTLTANGFVDRSDTQAAQLIGIVYNTPSQAARVPLITNYPFAPANNRAADWNDPGFPLRRDNTFYSGAVRIDYDVAPGLVATSLTAWSHIDVRQGLDLDGTAVDSIKTDNRGDASAFYQEVRLTGTYGAVNFVTGANYARDRSTQLDMFTIPYTTTTFGLPTGLFYGVRIDSRQQFRTKAAFGNVDLDVGDTITVHGGARYTTERLNYQACSRVPDPVTGQTFTSFLNILRARGGLAAITTIPTGECYSVDAMLTPMFKQGTQNEDNISWRVGLDWRPAPRALVYANVSRGYKGGSGPTVTALLNSQLSPVTQESVLAYEAGFKLSFLDNAVALNGAGFLYNYRNKQLKSRVLTTPTVFGALEALVNVPKSEVRGFEIGLSARPSRGLTLSAGATYLDTEVQGSYQGYSITGVLSDFGGQSFPYTPKYQFIGDAQYRWQLSSRLTATIGSSVNYRSATTAGFGNDPLLRIDRYSLVDLRGSVSDGTWTATLYGNNVFDTYYWTNIAKINDVVRRITGRPATYGIRVARSF